MRNFSEEAWVVTKTPSGKPKVVDVYNFSVCNMGGGSYKDQEEIANAISLLPDMVAALKMVLSEHEPGRPASTSVIMALSVISKLEKK